jgi:hypothetical protein
MDEYAHLFGTVLPKPLVLSLTLLQAVLKKKCTHSKASISVGEKSFQHYSETPFHLASKFLVRKGNK